mmetsp:Transcript_8575/g.20570  ORF Transcript_8575/g.20570 Transcript_8575/m.20570 type:complete len:227 (-) Transcript_8575:612-1292(-)
MLQAFRELNSEKQGSSKGKSNEWTASKPKSKRSTLDQVSVQMSSVVERARGTAGAVSAGASAARTGGASQGIAAASAESVLPASESCCPNLSFQERVYGCIGCFCIGAALGFSSYIMWTLNNYNIFAVLYTLGNIVSICGTGFLMGPKRQCRRMKAARRRWATAIYLLMMVITIVVAFTCHGSTGCTVIILLCVLVQWCALIWYMASYIPYGQRMIQSAFKSVTSF